MPRLPLPRVLTAAAALAVAAGLSLPVAAQDSGYYGMRYGTRDAITNPADRIWSGQPFGPGAGLPVGGRDTSRTMGRYGPYGADPFDNNRFGNNSLRSDPELDDPFADGQVQELVPRTAVGAAAQGYMPLPGAGTPGAGAMPRAGGIAAAPVLTPSPYGMQLQPPKRANLRVDNRTSLGTVNRSGGTAGGN